MAETKKPAAKSAAVKTATKSAPKAAKAEEVKEVKVEAKAAPKKASKGAAKRVNTTRLLEKYNAEIRAEQNRKAYSRNAFIRQCCDQQIERLAREKQQIEAATID